MPSTDQTALQFSALGIRDVSGIGLLFAQLRANFQSELAHASETGKWEQIRDSWIASDLAIRANWIDKAPDEFKPILSREHQSLLDFIELGLAVTRTLRQLGATTPDAVAAQFQKLRSKFDLELGECADQIDIGVTKVGWLGRRSGVIMNLTESWLKQSTVELRPIVGRELNALRTHIETAIEQRQSELAAAAESQALARDRIDLSLPGVQRPLGSAHLLRQTFAEIERIFLSLGFRVVEGPEIETPYYNFEALNIPEHHPARDTMDTFYLEMPRGAEPRLLRTHTSPVQVHTMESQQPPVRIIVPGKVYRRDNPDATHSYAFHQIEGLAVDTDVTFCEFKGTVEHFVREFLGPAIKTRLRPSYFPFTEPSVEVDASCFACGGSGCRLCKNSGWIELFGAGMVDPAVYGFVNYDPARVSGYAFGLGVDRLSQLKYGIDDVQLFFQNDVRFLRQFS